MNPTEHLRLIKENPGVYNFIPDDQLADLLLQLVETKSLFKKAKVNIKNGIDGKDGETPVAGIDYMSREQQEALIKSLISQIELPSPQTGLDGEDGIDGADAEITEEDIQSIIDTVYEAVFPLIPDQMSAEEVRNRLEVLTGDERLDKAAVKGIEEIETAILELQGRQNLVPGGGLGRRQVSEIVNDLISGIAGAPTFQSVFKNHRSYARTITKADGLISEISYDWPDGTVTATINRSSGFISSIVLSGALPEGLASTTWTISRDGDNQITGDSYS